ncbi:MAG: DUF92 domain-containing protein [Chloroflexi bacterium HGW-Chloroflexi-4]|jgi:uncharacterized protein (TIGR00297 family)|nr:MAG: DUF92 domain-containing protein [Chloroflexi bacterium HGW-Chloroflexi-4]
MAIILSPEAQLSVGIILALLVSGSAYMFRLLTVSGAIAAFILGAVTFGLGGLSWAVVLIAFFGSSNALSFAYKKRNKSAESMYSKGGRRDSAQVLANGGVAGLFVLLHLFYPVSWIPWLGFCAALAAANADTWATELGVLNPGNPILILTGKPAEPGTSGAISLVGTLASLAGAALIGLFGWLLVPPNLNDHIGLVIFSLATFGGLVGSLVDSILGASFQAIYYCPTCQKETEKHPLHSCGAETKLIRGNKWIDNDWVNLGCTISAPLLVILLGLLLLNP